MSIWRLGFGAWLVFGAWPSAHAEPADCDPWAAKLVSTQGPVEARRGHDARWRPLAMNATLCAGDAIRVGANGRAAVVLATDTVVRLDQHTTLTLTDAAAKPLSLIELVTGRAHFLSRVPQALKIKTPFINAGVEGTEFLLRIAADHTLLIVYEGRVLAKNEVGALAVRGGEAAVAGSRQAPAPRTVLRPRDAVNWALYYPPIVDPQPEDYADTALAERLASSVAAYRAGNYTEALARLGDVAAARDARLHAYRAGLLLALGRAEAAADEMQVAFRLPPRADAFALQALVEVVRNDKERARTLAQRALELDPFSTAANLALSYAHQAHFDLDAAAAAAEAAVQQSPDNVIARARLAELHLMRGRVADAAHTAERAVAANPRFGRAHGTLGFVHLVRHDTRAAQDIFARAIALDPADPLNRLGLGLALIRDGDLEQGRREIEIAVSLDPNNALLRSYLGKAYYEEKRAPLAADQYAIAKAIDPNDPTPWFYDAIRKQTQNRPVEALHDLQQAIARNDRRAVYRSRLLLDQDLAARGVSLARIYHDLGFARLAQVEAARSLAVEPANHSAHRFLADTYGSLRRHEIARASETLQAQLLQPLHINPVPPTLAETNLGIVAGAGPTTAGFSEFHPLFARDRHALNAGAVAGNHGTWGDEVVVSGLQGRAAYSIGQFHYETDGYRANNDLEQNIYNLFVQASPSDRASAQVEVRRREQENGDLARRFDPTNFSTVQRQHRDEDTVRVGYRVATASETEVIASLIYRDTDFARTDSRVVSPVGPFGPVVFNENRHADTQGYNGELQAMRRAGQLRYLFGAGYYRDEVTTQPGVRITSGPLLLSGDTTQTVTEQEHSNAYAYVYATPTPALHLTLGASADSLRYGTTSAKQVNPKLGVTWTATPDTVWRAAALRVFKRSLIANQTIEPTQVAGFNQFFDDPTDTDADHYGLAVDRRFTASLYGGLELSRRELEVPIFGSGTTIARFEDQQEDTHRAYLYWTPHSTLALGTEYDVEELESKRTTVDISRPRRLDTRRLPLSAAYFHPAGFFGRLTVTPFRQEIEQQATGGATTRDSDRFWITDVALGWRLPKRYGLVSLEVKNAFDKEFQFHDTDFQSGLPREPLLAPERLVLLRLALSWQ